MDPVFCSPSCHGRVFALRQNLSIKVKDRGRSKSAYEELRELGGAITDYANKSQRRTMKAGTSCVEGELAAWADDDCDEGIQLPNNDIESEASNDVESEERVCSDIYKCSSESAFISLLDNGSLQTWRSSSAETMSIPLHTRSSDSTSLLVSDSISLSGS